MAAQRTHASIARQAEAERERRAKIIDAEGEFQAAAKLLDAANRISQNPVTIQLRYLQTLREIGGNENSTIVFPFPIDLLHRLKATTNGDGGGDVARATSATSSIAASTSNGPILEGSDA